MARKAWVEVRDDGAMLYVPEPEIGTVQRVHRAIEQLESGSFTVNGLLDILKEPPSPNSARGFKIPHLTKVEVERGGERGALTTKLSLRNVRVHLGEMGR